MKLKLIALIPAAMVAATLAGCVVAPPPRAAYVEPYAAPPGVVYVAPTYAVPGPGYVWAYHPNYGWGYRHPNYGWHRGWR